MVPPAHPIACVAGFVRNAQGHVLVGIRTTTQEYCIPGGKIDTGETAIEALQREILEETSLHISNIRFLGYSDDLLDIGHYVTLQFECWEAGGQLTEPEPHKICQFQWLEVSKVRCLKQYQIEQGSV